MMQALFATVALLTPLSGLSGETITEVETSAAPEAAAPARIAWFTDWEQAKAEARRTGRPIFLQSAAPRCQGVPGMW